MKNIDFRIALILGLGIKCLIDGGSYPIALSVMALLGSLAYTSYLNQQKQFEKAEFEEDIKQLKERIGSMESKMALTMGTTRLK